LRAAKAHLPYKMASDCNFRRRNDAIVYFGGNSDDTELSTVVTAVAILWAGALLAYSVSF